MKKKVIAIGNRIMGDDGVAIKIAERLLKEDNNREIEIIIGETDYEYCMNEIDKDKDDFLIIIDSTYFDLRPGTVTVITLDEARDTLKSVYSQHQMNLVDSLKSYKENIKGYVVGIEIAVIDFMPYLSDTLEENFESIYLKVKELIFSLTGGF